MSFGDKVYPSQGTGFDIRNKLNVLGYLPGGGDYGTGGEGGYGVSSISCMAHDRIAIKFKWKKETLKAAQITPGSSKPTYTVDVEVCITQGYYVGCEIVNCKAFSTPVEVTSYVPPINPDVIETTIVNEIIECCNPCPPETSLATCKCSSEGSIIAPTETCKTFKVSNGECDVGWEKSAFDQLGDQINDMLKGRKRMGCNCPTVICVPCNPFKPMDWKGIKDQWKKPLPSDYIGTMIGMAGLFGIGPTTLGGWGPDLGDAWDWLKRVHTDPDPKFPPVDLCP